MRVLHLSYSDLAGGASVSAFRLHQALRAQGVESSMLVAKRVSDDPDVLQHRKFKSKWSRALRSRVEPRYIQWLAGGQVRQFSIGAMGCGPGDQIEELSPDVINLHWISGGFVSISDIARLRRPVVWTLHDMWAFTGGCHYAYDCEHYHESCGDCPQLGGGREDDLSRKTYLKKQRLWGGKPLQIVTPSRWLGECAAESSLFGGHPREVIPYGLDLGIFRPSPRKQSRERFGIDPSLPILCYGAVASLSDPRKGYDLLLEALRGARAELQAMGAEVLIFGTPEIKVETDPETGLRCHHVGHLSKQEDIALAYGCADVFVAPSRADNLPNTVLESIACGTPVAAFSIGGIPDMVRAGENGYLAEPFSTEQLGRGIVSLLADAGSEQRRGQISKAASAEYPEALQAQRYSDLYEKLVRG
ncbi:MAG: glycosyltransferase family 4 protein [Verrucomicrobiales bacterium]